MASLHPRDNGWHIRFGKRIRGKDNRKTIVLTEASSKEALAARDHVTHLEECNALGTPVSAATRKWLREMPPELHARLVEKVLVAHHRWEEDSKTVAGLCSHFLEWKAKTVEPESVNVYRKTTGMLERYFGGGMDITEIRPAQMDDFIAWAYGEVAKTTASRRIQTVKSIFRRAARQRWIDSRDYWEFFESVPKQTRTNPKRRHWVDADVFRRVMEHARTNEQRLIFALARWGGLRIPSELRGLTWDDVDREHDKIRIRAPKQKNHTYLIERWVPIWPEIRPHLDQQWDDAPPKTRHIILTHRSKNTSAHAGLFCRAAYRAGVTDSPDARPWPKLWINCRSTRATELRKQYPAAVVNYWLNHSEQTSSTHYQQWEQFDWRASK